MSKTPSQKDTYELEINADGYAIARAMPFDDWTGAAGLVITVCPFCGEEHTHPPDSWGKQPAQCKSLEGALTKVIRARKRWQEKYPQLEKAYQGNYILMPLD